MSHEIGIGDMRKVSSVTSSEAAAPVTPKKLDPADQGKGPAIADADQTTLSSIGGLVSQALEQSDVRTEKVASLQQAISAGKYNISSSDVADKLLQSLLD
jgi:negative regulator of flagellin synthesis FlgM